MDGAWPVALRSVTKKMTMITEAHKQQLLAELPLWIEQDPAIRVMLARLLRGEFADKQQTESRFDRLLDELRRDREAQARRWAEAKAESDKKWEENNRKWEESRQEFQKIHEEIMAQAKKFDRGIGALGARWGVRSEKAFRDALAGILEENFGVKVLNICEYDDSGEVFGRPEQVELDIIIKNGTLILCELRSSIDKAGIYIFERKARFYEKRHGRQADKLIAISPMIDARALQVAQELGIQTYGDSTDVEVL